MPVALKLRTITRPFLQQPALFKQTSIRMSSTNQHGQGASHATGESAVPNKVQEAAPKGLEDALPEGVGAIIFLFLLRATILMQIIKVHPTGSNPNNQSTNQTHAKDGGDASIVPKKIQEKLPESVERAVPNVIHDTGDK
ncbi:hypothetical protein IAQ61_005493 [Plenodomus lingam]|uniref:uncharacterized protein n=1 Tax=Leptosphaeria maculans TaxID=5022 RepID=UPI003329E2F0|nr:hypothetical protein IAQ61_005493 [Plenodomus lingam]